MLAEYGIPKSAIKKLENNIPQNLEEDDVLNEIRESNLIDNSELIDYEKEKIRENL
ncbi:hypothetical protein C5S36_07025 [Candidatus Methanophagaceae archaeon]|nr:hypothetical protein C5S36_07025 [Methanophagales archaeon]